MKYTARSAADAAIMGQRTYQGKPCRHGHQGLRYTVNSSCVECTKARARADRQRARADSDQQQGGE